MATVGLTEAIIRHDDWDMAELGNPDEGLQMKQIEHRRIVPVGERAVQLWLTNLLLGNE